MQFRQFALSLYFTSPKAYKYLSQLLSLPTANTLRTWLSAINIKTEIVPQILELIKEKAKNWEIQDRACCLIFDEMSLKRNLYYDPKEDFIRGYVDDPRERTSGIANIAVLALVSGIANKWIRPVAFLTGDGTVCSRPLSVIEKLITELKACGLCVKALVWDQNSSNCVIARTLGGSPERPFFITDKEKIYFTFDVPHRMKCTKSNLGKHDHET